MLQYLNLKSTKFEVGQRVEVKTKEGPRYGIVRADQGSNYYHVEYEGGNSDLKVSARHMKLHNLNINRGDSNVSVGGKSSASLRSMYSRFAGGISSITPTDSNDVDGSSVSSRNEPMRSSFASRKRNSVLDAKSSPEEEPTVEQSVSLDQQVATSVKKKKSLKRRILTNVELQVLDRIRQCNAKLQTNNGNVFSSKLDLSYLQLHEIPEKCHELYFLREIVVRKNEFKRFDDIIRSFPNINKVDASFNLFVPPLEMGESTKQDSFDPSPFQGLMSSELKLNFLDLSGCNLSALPHELIQQAPYLETLIIRKNMITELPEWLSQFKLLQKLDCADNLIQLSPSFCKLLEEELSKLSDLNFDRNPCLEIIEKNLKGEGNEESLMMGQKTRYLLQKVRSFIWYFSIS
jgi:Leucine-rich repeat (LRR) protein